VRREGGLLREGFEKERLYETHREREIVWRVVEYNWRSREEGEGDREVR
jgi:hypothetical protein